MQTLASLLIICKCILFDMQGSTNNAIKQGSQSYLSGVSKDHSAVKDLTHKIRFWHQTKHVNQFGVKFALLKVSNEVKFADLVYLYGMAQSLFQWINHFPAHHPLSLASQGYNAARLGRWPEIIPLTDTTMWAGRQPCIWWADQGAVRNQLLTRVASTGAKWSRTEVWWINHYPQRYNPRTIYTHCSGPGQEHGTALDNAVYSLALKTYCIIADYRIYTITSDKAASL